VTAHWPQTSHLISGLAGFSTYHFYLRIQYGKKDTDKYGSFGQAVACSLRTRISGLKDLHSLGSMMMITKLMLTAELNTASLSGDWSVQNADFRPGTKARLRTKTIQLTTIHVET